MRGSLDSFTVAHTSVRSIQNVKHKENIITHIIDYF